MFAVRFSRFALLSAPLAILAAGCGGGGGSNPSNGTITITAPTLTVNTLQTLQFSATVSGGGSVNWSIVSGGNADAGAGSISASGLYIPEQYTESDGETVTIEASLSTDATNHVTQNITVTPGIQITPEVSAITPSSASSFYATVYELGGGNLNWTTTSSASGGSASNAGTFSGATCQHGNSNNPFFTACSVSFTAGSLSGSASQVTYAQAVLSSQSTDTATAKVLLNTTATVSPNTNQAIQAGNDIFGTSGGNYNDITSTECCGGTLGSLVSINGTQYILSNNHVMGESDSATFGDAIVQPGLIDVGCDQTQVNQVGTLTYYPQLENDSTAVDIAIAANTGMTTDGSIFNLGALSGGVPANAPPASDIEDITVSNAPLPAQVVKSGRTTGLTCSSLNAVFMNVSITYNKLCDGTGASFEKTYTNQIDINGAQFSDAGDSGSLVVDQATAQPVGLLYAGSTDDTVANPIGDVITALNSYAAANGGGTASFVGGGHHSTTCVDYDANQVNGESARTVTPAELSKASTAIAAHRAALVSQKNGILGLATSRSKDASGEAAIIVYTDKSRSDVQVPQTIGGVRTIAIATDAGSVTNGTAPTELTVSSNVATLARTAIDSARIVKDKYAAQMMKDPAIFGVGVGKSLDNPNEAVLIVYVDQTKTPKSTPQTLDGTRVRYVHTQRARAYNWKNTSRPSSGCASKSMKLKQAAATVVIPSSTIKLP